MKRYSIRVSAAVISMIICTLFVNLHMLGEMIQFPERLRNDISKYDKPFEKLKDFLPSHCVVGYISDEQEDKNATRYRFAQYALAPVIVTKSLEPQLIVGNFSNASAQPEIYRKYGLVLVKDFGSGLILFSRGIH